MNILDRIKKCPKCGTSYNKESVDGCPICKTDKEKVKDKKIFSKPESIRKIRVRTENNTPVYEWRRGKKDVKYCYRCRKLKKWSGFGCKKLGKNRQCSKRDVLCIPCRNVFRRDRYRELNPKL